MLSRFGNHKTLHLDSSAFAIQQQGNDFDVVFAPALNLGDPGESSQFSAGRSHQPAADQRPQWLVSHAEYKSRVVQSSFMKLLRLRERIPPLFPHRTYVVAKSRVFFRAFYSSHPNFLSPIDMETINTTERLAQLRQLMKDRKVDIYSTK